MLRQSAFLLITPITVNKSAPLCNCSPMDRALDYVMALTLSYSLKLVWTWTFWSVTWSNGVQMTFFFCFRYFTAPFVSSPQESPGVAIRLFLSSPRFALS